MNVIHSQADVTVRSYDEPRDAEPFVDALARLAGRLIVGPDERARMVSLGKGEKTAQAPRLVRFASADLFASPRKAGQTVAKTYPNQALTRAVARANDGRPEPIKRITVHGLRHTFAAITLSEAGGDILSDFRALGHARGRPPRLTSTDISRRPASSR